MTNDTKENTQPTPSAPEAQGTPVNDKTEVMSPRVRPDHSFSTLLCQLPPSQDVL
jgi:hypothetical protein